MVNNGTLKARGTPAARIWFTANASSPVPESWMGIQVDTIGNDIGRVEMDYCNITYSKYALTITGGGNNSVNNSEISDTYDGVRIYSSANNTVANTNIPDCFNNGILLGDSSKNCILNNNMSSKSGSGQSYSAECSFWLK